MTPARYEVVGSVAEILASSVPGHPLRVGVDGVCGAGKTTFARDLVAVVQEHGRHAIHLDSDGFHHVRAIRHRQADPARGYYEDAYDFEALATQVLEPLGNDHGPFRFARRVHDLVTDEVVTDELDEAIADAVLVIDCTFLQRGQLRALFDEIVYLDVDLDVATARGVQRDAAALGGRLAAEMAYERRYAAACRIYLAEEGPSDQASILVDHTDPRVPRLLRGPRRRTRPTWSDMPRVRADVPAEQLLDELRADRLPRTWIEPSP